MPYTKIQYLLEDDFAKLTQTKILLLGVGGVGGICLECLIKSGITNITIVDYDTFEISNQNRQLYSELHIGECKVDALKKHYPSIQIIKQKIDPQWIENFDFKSYDIILDAIDDTQAKLALAQKCYKKLISSFGSANRIDPTKITTSDIWKSYGDKLGSKIRYELRKRKFNKKYTVIFSTEEIKNKNNGTFMGVTATFGLTMCSLALQKIIK